MTTPITLFTKEKPAKAIINIASNKGTYISEVSSDIDTTYAHTVSIVKKLNKMDLIETRKDGRKKVLEATDHGVQISNNLMSIKQMFNNSI